jgi:hypothetical protein
MAESTAIVNPPLSPVQPRMAETARKDNWWLGPVATFAGLMVFIVYATWAGTTGKNFEIREIRGPEFAGHEVAPYLSPFYSPLLYDAQSPHAWIHQAQPSWWPNIAAPDWWPGLLPWPFKFSAAALILLGPALFRFTCYYYRKAYYRAFWLDPHACAVGEPRKSYLGENSLPLILQNLHRYTMYIATIFLVILWYDAIESFRWPTDSAGKYLGGAHQFGMGLGSLVMLINVVCLSGFTLGCNSVRHLLGGRSDCFSCPMSGGSGKDLGVSANYKAWRISTMFNEYHMQWAWISLFTVGFTDFYIRMCSLGVFSDVRFF